MSECKFYLVRHGQSLGNLNRIYLGHTDVDLSELGYKQAEITAEHLRGVHFDSIYSSDLKRAHNTALPHARIRNIPVIDSMELREIFLGDWENVPIDELKTRPDFTVGWTKHYGTFKVPGGEGVMEAGERFKNEVERIAKENPDKCILIAAHAAVIRIFFAIISGIKPEDVADAIPFPTNASYSTLTYRDGKFYPEEYSCDSHFKDKPQNILA